MKKLILHNIDQLHKFLTPSKFPQKVITQTTKILEDIKSVKDKALLKYTAQFDGVKLSLGNIEIPKTKLKSAWGNLPSNIKKSFVTVKNNVEKFHKKQLPRNWKQKLKNGYIGQIYIPVQKVGIYIPGGKFPLVSTVFMTTIPAKIAGVEEIIMATPPRKDGTVSEYILAAAYLTGVDRVFRIGGVQAIGALAYGTKIVPKVDLIVGPGNIYVTCAKKLVYGEVNIDMLAGPSEIAILCDESARIEHIWTDLLSQLEHDQYAKAFLITTSKKIYKNLEKGFQRYKSLIKNPILRKSIKDGLFIIYTKELPLATEAINHIAPEHLEIITRSPGQVVKKIKNAGLILIGPYTPVALSDFACGTNHVLPTGGTAKAFSGLNIRHFLKPVSVVKYSKSALQNLYTPLKDFTYIEGLPAHWLSIETRFRK